MLLSTKGVIFVVFIGLSYQHLQSSSHSCVDDDEDPDLLEDEGSSRSGYSEPLNKRVKPTKKENNGLEGASKQAPGAASKPKLAGGIAIEDENKYPSFMQVTISRGELMGVGCGGVIISDRLVLTAAHCVLDKEGEIDKDIESIAVTATKSRTDRVDQYINKVCWPADFDKYDPDIAILRMQKKYEPSSARIVRPALFPSEPLGFDQQAYAMGLGKTAKDDIEGAAKLTELPVKRRNCTFAMMRNPMVLCLEANDPKHLGNLCEGDSGGPVLVKTKDGTDDIVVGITSRTTGECVPGKVYGLTFYSNVYYLMPEIRNLMLECNKADPYRRFGGYRRSGPMVGKTRNGVRSMMLFVKPEIGGNQSEEDGEHLE